MSESNSASIVHHHLHERWGSIVDTLIALARIPSVSWPAFDAANVATSANAVAQLLTELDLFDTVEVLRSTVPDTDALGQPAVVARRAPRGDAKTVLLYAHHDVQPPGDPAQWDSPAFEPEIRGERLFGRGTADDKAGIVTHVTSLSLLSLLTEDVNLGIVVFVEGEEEFGSPSFDAFLEQYREQLDADVIVVADSGNWSETVPALTTSLRGNVTFALTVRTLSHGVHSGMFGGAVPDAMMAAARLIDSFYTSDGSVAVDGLVSQSRAVPPYDTDQLRTEAGMRDGTSFISSGDLMHRLWSQPSITVTGIDAPPVASASNTLLPSVRARVSVRVAPGQQAMDALAAITAHITTHVPFGAEFDIDDVNLGEPFLDAGDGPAARAARQGMRDAWGVDPVDMGVGGSIPFIATFKQMFPAAEVLVTGVEDPDSRAHGTNESVHLDVLKKGICAQTLLLLALNANDAE